MMESKWMTRRELAKLLLVAVFFLCGIFPAIWFLGTGDAPVFLLKEDGLYESAAGVLCLVGSVVSFAAFHRSGETLKQRNLWLLLFALGLFGLTGEEISWGQRLFDLEVPAEALRWNYQNELNVHNARFIQTGNNRLSDLLMHLLSAYLIVFPLGLAVFPSVNRFVRKIRFPVPGLLTVLIAVSLKVANSICYRVIYGSKYSADTLHVGEAFESLLEICLVCVAVELLLRETSQKKIRRTT
jgi:hypothetical protein